MHLISLVHTESKNRSVKMNFPSGCTKWYSLLCAFIFFNTCRIPHDMYAVLLSILGWFYHQLNAIHTIDAVPIFVRVAAWSSGCTVHYSDVNMGAMASQITSLTIVYSTVYSGTDQRKPVNSSHNGPVTRKMTPWHFPTPNRVELCKLSMGQFDWPIRDEYT